MKVILNDGEDIVIQSRKGKYSYAIMCRGNDFLGLRRFILPNTKNNDLSTKPPAQNETSVKKE